MQKVSEQENISFLKQYKGFLAGCIGGIAQVLTGQPFDIIKVRLQASNNSEITMTSVFKDLLKSEGFKGFYKGTIVPLIAISGQVSVQFGIFETTKAYFQKKEKSQTISDFGLFVCSAFAGFGQSFIASPVEHIRIKMQTAKPGQFLSTGHCIQSIWKSNGIKGLYKGLPACQVRDVVGNVFYFIPYNYTLKLTENPSKGQGYLTMCQLLAGGMAGIFCWTSSIPFDVIKSRLQADSLTNPQYSSVTQCAKQTFQEFGFSGFFKGVGPCLIRAVFVNACTFGVYEQAKKQIEKYE